MKYKIKMNKEIIYRIHKQTYKRKIMRQKKKMNPKNTAQNFLNKIQNLRLWRINPHYTIMRVAQCLNCQAQIMYNKSQEEFKFDLFKTKNRLDNFRSLILTYHLLVA